MDKQPSGDRVLPPFKKASKEVTDQDNSGQPANTNEYAFFGLAHNQTTPLGFKIFFAAGKIAAIHYHDLISPFEFDGACNIKLKTPALELKITGKNLSILFDHLFENRVAWIKEPDTSFAQVSEGQPEIEAITLEPVDRGF